jgi:L-asparaginase II
VGDPEGYVYARSSAKPFQALPLVLSGAVYDFGLTDEELAVACASHNAEEPHLRAVGSILEKAGLSEDDLQNGAHPPLYAPAAMELACSGEEPRNIHGNCSGKHAGMLAVCVHEGWATSGYRDPSHPLQMWILEIIARVCGLELDEILLGGDGCGVPTFGMPLENLATGFARLATGALPDDLAEAANKVRGAMREHPYMVGGTERLRLRSPTAGRAPFARPPSPLSPAGALRSRMSRSHLQCATCMARSSERAYRCFERRMKRGPLPESEHSRHHGKDPLGAPGQEFAQHPVGRGYGR